VNRDDLAGRKGRAGVGQVQQQAASRVPGKLELLPQLTVEPAYSASADPVQVQVECGIRRRHQRDLQTNAVRLQLSVQGADQLACVPLNAGSPL
jgi:hypothetical protein